MEDKRLLIPMPGSINTGMAPNLNKAKVMMEKSRQRTVPQIWINNLHIGGCTDLEDLNDLLEQALSQIKPGFDLSRRPR